MIEHLLQLVADKLFILTRDLRVAGLIYRHLLNYEPARIRNHHNVGTSSFVQYCVAIDGVVVLGIWEWELERLLYFEVAA